MEQDNWTFIMEENHCTDCCCARSWTALQRAWQHGLLKNPTYNGKSIPEHITRLVDECERLKTKLAFSDAGLIAIHDNQLQAENESLRKEIEKLTKDNESSLKRVDRLRKLCVDLVEGLLC